MTTNQPTTTSPQGLLAWPFPAELECAWSMLAPDYTERMELISRAARWHFATLHHPEMRPPITLSESISN